MSERSRTEAAAARGSGDQGEHGDGLRLESFPRFTYLGRVMTAGDDDWPAVAGNLNKARRSWGRLQRIMRREGATPHISGSFFKAVVQQVLLFGAETWVVTPNMERALNEFLHGAARRLTGRQARRGKNREWYYPSLEGDMREAGLTDISKSIANRLQGGGATSTTVWS